MGFVGNFGLAGKMNMPGFALCGALMLALTIGTASVSAHTWHVSENSSGGTAKVTETSEPGAAKHETAPAAGVPATDKKAEAKQISPAPVKVPAAAVTAPAAPVKVPAANVPAASTAPAAPPKAPAANVPAASAPKSSSATQKTGAVPKQDTKGASPTTAAAAVDNHAQAASAPKTSTGASVSPTKDAPASPPAAATASQPVDWHRMQMRLSGSMCVACLKELEDNIRKLPGVEKVKVQKATTNFFQPVSPDISNWADAVVIFDGRRLPVDLLRDAIRQDGYHSYKIVNRQLGRAPEEKDMKF